MINRMPVRDRPGALELIKLQEWVRLHGLRVCVLFEGRDAAGKGGVIKRTTQSLNPRICRVVALGTPTEEEYREFLRACPLFEEMLIRSGLTLIKYWFSVNDEEQEKRFQERMRNPIKRWKLSPMDIESRRHWVDYSKAKDVMLAHTDTKKAPWYVVNADNKKRARLNCIAHLLQQVPYQNMIPVEVELPPPQSNEGYKRPKMSSQRFVPNIY